MQFGVGITERIDENHGERHRVQTKIVPLLIREYRFGALK